MAAKATKIPIMIIIFWWSNLSAPSLDPIKPPIRTTMDNGIIKPKSISLVIVWAINPLIEFVSINKLAEAAACLGLAKPDIIKIGESHIPPPIPTRPEILPRRAPNGVVINAVLTKFKFIFLIFSRWNVILLLPDNSNAAEAEKRDMTKINVNIFSGRIIEPPINAKGIEINNGNDNLNDRWPAFR